MKPWPAVLVAALPLLCAAAPTEPADTEEYWMRGYSIGQQWAAYYNLTLKVEDVSKAAEKIEAIAVRAGGVSVQNQVMDSHHGVPSRCLCYSIPTAAAAKLTKQLFDIGEVSQYNVNRQSSPEMLQELKNKIAKLSRELDGHAAQLQDMPAARAVLSGTLNKLKQAQEASEASSGKSRYSIYVQPAGS